MALEALNTRDFTNPVMDMMSHRGEFNVVSGAKEPGAVLTQEQLLEALSGYSPAKYAYVSNGQNGHLQEDRAHEEEKKKLKAFESGFRGLNYGGIEISFENVLSHMDTMAQHYDQVAQENMEAIRIDARQIAVDENGVPIQTAEELAAFQGKQKFCSAETKYSVDQVTVIDGALVSVDGLNDATIANDELAEEKEKILELRERIQSGEIDINDPSISEELKAKLVEIEKNGGVMPEPEPMSISDQLNALSGEQLGGEAPIIKTSNTVFDAPSSASTPSTPGL